MSLELYTWGTPNGWKVSAYLEALGLSYELKLVNIIKGEQKLDWFLKINPNGRIPALVDNSTGITISQTGAILQYLADTYDKKRLWSYEPGTKEYWLQQEILIFQVAENGPIQGQANWFTFYASEDIEYAKNRYKNETKRIYGVFEKYLERNKENGLFLVGNHYSPADFALVCWANGLERLNIDTGEYPLLKQWLEKINQLKAIQVGITKPERKAPPPRKDNEEPFNTKL